MVNRKLKPEEFISIIFIIEMITYIVIKGGMNHIITPIDILSIFMINFLTLALYVVILFIKYNNESYISHRIRIPFAVMIAICEILGLSFIFIPIFRFIPTLLKVWTFFLIGGITVPALIYLIKYYKNKTEIKNIESFYKDNIEKYEYYRELLKNYSPAILSLVYNGRIKYEDSLVATILDLKLNNYIDIKKDGIQILNKDTTDLFENQKDLLKILEMKINRKRFISFHDIALEFSKHKFKLNWIYGILNEAEKKGVCHTKTIVSNIIETLLKIFFFSFFPISIITAIFLCNGSIELLFLYLMIVIIHVTILVIGANLHKYNKIYLFIRSKEGIALQYKMVGLKNYIKDYSQISQKELNQVNIWEDYLIYAVIFDLKGKLDAHVKKLYNNLVQYEPTVKEYIEIEEKRMKEDTERIRRLLEEKRMKKKTKKS